MNRRALLTAGAGAAVASIVPVAPGKNLVHSKVDMIPGNPGGRRISIVKGDPGELFYAECCADDRKVKVLLDGVEQKWCITADERTGMVLRCIETEKGNLAFNAATEEILEEIVYGNVVIEIA